MYQALYRKWRPKSFDDVVGQNHVTKTLKSEVKSGRISHAYLFTGSRGTGKTSCAKILSKAINCLNPSDGNPCGECEICKSIDSENMLDIVEIDAASNNGVENIRSMREEVVFSPAKCKYRVYIVDEVHMLSSGAFNAFLKVLEEPPPHVVFILATTEIHKLPLTVVSRCQRFDFHRISQKDICERLKYICGEENIKIEEKAAELIAKAADGAMRDALSILDRCSGACKGNIDEKSAEKTLGISGKHLVLQAANSVFDHNFKACLELADKLYIESKNFVKFCEELMEYFRKLMVCKATGSNFEGENENACTENLKLGDILKALEVLQDSYKNMTSGADKKLEIEIAFVKLCEIFNEKPNQTVEEKISEPPKTKPEPDEVKNEPFPETVSESIVPEIDNENKNDSEFADSWNKITEALKNNKSLKSLYISLMGSNAYKRGNYILIESKNSLAFELLRKAEYRTAIKKIIKDVTGKPYNLGPYTSAPKEEKSEEESKEKSKEDPLDNLISKAQQEGINVNQI